MNAKHARPTDFADKQNEVGFIECDEFGQSTHERLIVLHTTGRIDEDDIQTLPTRLLNALLRHMCSVLIVSTRIQRNVECLGVSFELLNGTSTKRVASATHKSHTNMHTSMQIKTCSVSYARKAMKGNTVSAQAYER